MTLKQSNTTYIYAFIYGCVKLMSLKRKPIQSVIETKFGQKDIINLAMRLYQACAQSIN